MADHDRENIKAVDLPLGSNRFYALDGLRAIAAAFVVVAHLWAMYFPVRRVPYAWTTNWLWYPHLAVDVFIVLSGFCLAFPKLKRSSRDGVWRFLARRSVRILPPYFVALLLALGVNFLIRASGNDHGSPWTGAMILSNTLLMQDWLPRWNTLNPAFWSVALEWKMYFIFLPLLWLFVNRGVVFTLFCAGLSAIGLTVVFWKFHGIDWEISSPWYIFCFAVGVAAVRMAEEVNLRKLLVVLLISSSVGMLVLLNYAPRDGLRNVAFNRALPAIDTLAAMATACGLALLWQSRSQLGKVKTLPDRLLSCYPLVWFGEISYSVYLVHMPFLWLVRGVMNKIQPTLSPSARLTLMAIVGLPLLIVCSYIFFIGVERPSIMLSKRLKGRPVEALAGESSPIPVSA